MKKKRILSVLSVILGCLLLFACTTANNTQATESSSAESADPNVSAEEKKPPERRSVLTHPNLANNARQMILCSSVLNV